jgi:alpha-amylase
MKRKIISFSLLLVFVLSACAPETPEPRVEGQDFPWWNDAVFYEIFVRSFYDSDGDGIGDFNGIIEKLDYLNDGDPQTDADLGITGIWLMPIFPSPSYHGYDVTDYYAVNPQYGSLEDFEKLLEEAHKRGIAVIIDLVLNHTSDQHPWFLEASQDPDSEYRDWYLWEDKKPNYIGPWGQTVWHPSGESYYYGLFTSFMPDLNYLNPDVTQEMNEVVRFWLENVGVDGFRLDAAKHLIENGKMQENTAATHSWYENFRPAYKNINPDALMIAEIFDSNASIVKAYTGDELDLAFHFGLADSFVYSALTGSGMPPQRELSKTTITLPEMGYATFLTNHDQDRVMSVLEGDTDKAKTAASLLLTSPGVPFLYYGEEVGMMGVKPDEDIRRPMQWSGEEGAGFTSGIPWRAPDSSYLSNNVVGQNEDPDSLLNHYRSLIHFRQDHSALRVGYFYEVITRQIKLFACLRISDQESLLVVINTSSTPLADFELTVKDTGLVPGEYLLVSIYGPKFETSLVIDEDGSFTITPDFSIPPYTTLILELAAQD